MTTLRTRRGLLATSVAAAVVLLAGACGANAGSSDSSSSSSSASSAGSAAGSSSAGGDTSGSGGSSGSNAPAARGEITIGLLATLTGTTASDGQGAQRGAELAIKELNAAGGVAGYTFKLRAEDTKNESNDVVTAGVQNLLSDDSVKAVVTGYASTTNFEINNFARAGMVYILGGGTAQTAEIVGKDPAKYPTIWSVTPSYAQYGTGPVDLADQWAAAGTWKPRNKSAYIVTSDNAYSKGISTDLKAYFGKKGWSVVGEQTVPFGAVSDWGTVLADIRSKNPDYVVNTDYQVSNEITFLQQFLQNPTKSLMFLQYGPNQPAWLDEAKASGNGVLYNNLAGVIASDKNPETVTLQKAYQAAYGTSAVDPQAVITYQAVKIYADALKKVGDADKKTEIGQAIGASTTKAAGGTIVFDQQTHLAKAGDDFVPLQSFQIQDAKPVLIAPEKYAGGSFVLPPWFQ
ncbi:ABC transporter substrate-binding protein [Nakamurella endophytica]|uniref:ABC transporter substrate-binding protein n=1 Tax=Nakamurella endophytica TaxID=1748367 RepID=A0A917SU28_9ACTN|nr:ABC transporter substrate-binding protein [Nakamurella endophytica]GGL99064.1 ABC transporter substrate-binding protein [Nakamurella endophytica]